MTADALRERASAWSERWGAPPEVWLGELRSALDDSPDAPMALIHWERWLESRAEPWREIPHGETLRLLTTLFSQSQFLADIVIRDGLLMESLGDSTFLAQPRDSAALSSELQSLPADQGSDERRRALCAWRRRHLVRIGLRDITDAASMESLAAELADLAEAVTRAALDAVWTEMVQRYGEPRTDSGEAAAFAVLGMGKLGGRELNFSSDIDLIFIYSAEGETTGRGGGRTGRVDNALFMRRLSERLIDFIGAIAPEGRLYRVDMRLRPEGKVGPLARSLESLETYFATQARLWERLAYTKASVVAHRGPDEFADAVTNSVRRFAYGEAPGPELPRALADLKHRIDREVLRDAASGTEVKRGVGGIREIEFVVGLFQLVHGHADDALRTPNLLETLRRLEERRLFTEAEARRLRRAYETLRRIEHRLQMMAERQTHTLPRDAAALESLARRLGWREDESGTVRRRFLDDCNQIASMVHQAFLQHIGAPEISGIAADVAVVLDEEVPAAKAGEVLARFGFAEPESAVAVARGLGRGGAGAYVDAGAQRAFERLLPALLAWCPQVPSPDLALRQLARFVDAYKARGVLFALMAEQPQLVEVLMRLFGAGELLGGLLIRHPEFFDSVVARALGLALPDEVIEDLWSRLRPRRDDPERQIEALRTLRQMCHLTVGLRFVLGLDTWPRLADQLSDLAEFCLREAWRLVIDAGAADATPLACIALGKFGGREINVGSDLDVILVARPPGELAESDALEWLSEVTRRAERLTTAMGEPTPRGVLWELDTRLRPEGRNAPLVCTDRRLVNYFARGAQLWEFQTFLRARPVAGDLALGRQVIADVHRAVCERLAATNVTTEIRAMRERLERNADHPGGHGAVDLKRDPGGIVDVEFLVQAHQLEFLHESGAAPEVRTASAIANLARLDDGERTGLRGHLLTLRMLECHLRLLQGTSGSAIPADPARWRHLALAHLGPRTGADELRDHVREAMAAVRIRFDSALGGLP